MASPFKLFRKHQKIFLAALTLMAMLAFGLGDVIMRMTGTGAAPTGDVVVETIAGSLTQSDIMNLRRQRSVVNRFIFNALMETNPDLARNAQLLSQNPQFAQFLPSIAQQVQQAQAYFGGYSAQDLLFNYLHRQEAKKLGIVISDAQIGSQLDQITNGKLTTEQFKSIVRAEKINPKELYEILREELAAVTAFRMAVPFTPQTPEQIWKLYQRLNTREKIEVAPLPVKDFVAQVADPSEQEIAAYFEQHKNKFEMAGGGEHRPGFRQPQKVRLQYLQLTYEAAEQFALRAKPITDEEVVAYYEKNKATDQSMQIREIPSFKDADPIMPEFAPEPGTDPTGPKLIPDERPEEKQPEEKKPADAPATEKPEKEDTEKPEKKDPKPDDPCAADDEEKPAAVEKPAEKKELPADADAKPGSPERGTKVDAKETDKAPGKDAPSKELPAETAPAAKGDAKEKDKTDAEEPAEPAPPKFRPLDDELRGIIRTRLEDERANQELKERTGRAVEAMGDLGRQFVDEFGGLVNLKEGQQEKLAERAKTELNKLAKQLEMEYGETPLVSFAELNDKPGIGRSREISLGDDLMRGGGNPVAVSVFGGEQRLCRPFQSEDSITHDRFALWKIEDVPAHVPELTDAGIKEQVIAAWKTAKALDLAKARAEELAKQASQAKEPLEKVFGSATVTGDPKGLALTVRESPEFSWMRESAAPSPGSMFGSSAPPTLGNPIVVTNPGSDFMETVFDKLQEGETGVALNDDASVYYVVRVVSRRAADREQFNDAPLFLGSVYQQLAATEELRVRREYDKALEQKYKVKWRETDEESAADFGE
jgi:hypothetical protein